MSKSSKFSLPGLEILTFAFATWLQGYLVTDSFDLAFLLLQEFEIEYFEASLENHGFDHLRNNINIMIEDFKIQSKDRFKQYYFHFSYFLSIWHSTHRH